MLTAADVMTTEVVSITPDTPVRDIAELLYTRRISGVPVVEADGRVIGIVSEGDLIGHAAVTGERRRSPRPRELRGLSPSAARRL